MVAVHIIQAGCQHPFGTISEEEADTVERWIRLRQVTHWRSVMWTLVFILLGQPYSSIESYSESIVIDGFTTEQACRNAGFKIKHNVPEARGGIQQHASFTCVEKSL